MERTFVVPIPGMFNDIDEVIGCEPVALTEYHKAEIWRCIESIRSISTSTQLVQGCDRLEHVLSVYGNKFLLFSIVPNIVSRLVDLIHLSTPPLDRQSESAFVIFYTFSKFVGFKQTSKYLPVEINLLKTVLECAEYYVKDESVFIEQDQYKSGILSGIQIWLYILVKNPFNFKNITRGEAPVNGLDSTSFRIKTVIEKSFKDLSKLNGTIYAQLYTRNSSNVEALKQYFNELVDGIETPRLALNKLQTLHYIFKLGRREELFGFTREALDYCNSCFLKLSSSNVLTCYCIKLYQRLIMIHLPSRPANWRYQRKTKRIEEAFGVQELEVSALPSIEEANKMDANDRLMIEEILSNMKKCLYSDSNDVRWASAKGMARIMAKLPENYAQTVVANMVNQLGKDKSACFWNGSCLLLAELTTRGCILPTTIPLILNIVKEAMVFDYGGFMNTTETNVRDSACYICWSVARAYPKEMFESSLESFSHLLLYTSLFDRDVNVRRAASAAFQEHVGRHGAFSHGIQVLVAIDFSTVSMIKRCFLEVCVQVAEFQEYLRPMLEFLCNHKIINWNDGIRELAGHALKRLALKDKQYSRETLLQSIVEQLMTAGDIPHKHGLLFACSAIIWATSNELKSSHVTIGNLLAFISDNVDLMRNRGLEQASLLVRGMAKVLKCILDNDLMICPATISKWMSIVELDLEMVKFFEVKGMQETTKELLVQVLEAVFGFWYRHDMKTTILKHLAIYTEQLRSTESEDRYVAIALAIENLPKNIVLSYSEEIKRLGHLLSNEIFSPKEKTWVDARIASMGSLVSLYTVEGTQDQFVILLKCLNLCYKDQTTTRNGDIGRLVRQSAMENTIIVLELARKNGMLNTDIIDDTLTQIFGLFFDTVDNNIRIAHETVRLILGSEISIDNKEALASVFDKPVVNPEDLIVVLDNVFWRQHVFEKAVISLGSLVISVSNVSWKFLYTYFMRNNMKMQSDFMDEVSTMLLQCFKTLESLDDRIRFCRAIGVMVERQVFEVYEVNPSESIPFTELCNEIINIGKGKCSMKLKHVALRTVGSFMMFNYSCTINAKARKTLCLCLVCPYSALRSLASELLQHYLSMAAENIYEDENIQSVLSCLNELDWTKPKEEVEQAGQLINRLLSLVNNK